MGIEGFTVEMRKAAEAMERPVAFVDVGEGEVGDFGSFLGGVPAWPEGMDWPVDAEGEPMHFLAQLALAELPASLGLPREGLLQFFLAADDTFGWDGGCRVVHHPATGFETDDEAALERIEEAEEFEDNALEDPSERLPISFAAGTMPGDPREVPPAGWSWLEALERHGADDLPDAPEFDALRSVLGDRMVSHVGGWPHTIQDIVYDAGDVCLLHLEPECGISVGDAGDMNFVIRADDLRRGDFSRVRYEWTCC